MQTALRETHEEIGIDPKKVDILGSLSDLYIPITNILVKPFIAVTTSNLNFKTDPIEVNKLHRIKLNDLKSNAHKKSEKWNLRGHEVNVPFYLLENQKVWGATAMMLSELETILENFNSPE